MTSRPGGQSRPGEHEGHGPPPARHSYPAHADRRNGRRAQAPPSFREAYAGLVSRLLALVLDALALAIVVPLVGTGVPGLWGALVLGPAPGWLQVSAGVLAALVPFGYFWLCWWAVGHTLGGALFGTAVRRPDGERLGPLRSAVRSLVGIALAPIWLAGLLYSVLDRRRRGLHDVLLGTVVLRA